MKKVIVGLHVCILATLHLPSLAIAAGDASSAGIAIIALRGVEEGVTSAIQEHLESSLHVSVRVVTSKEKLRKKEQIKQVSELMEKRDHGAIVLADSGGTKKKFVVALKPLKAVILDVKRIQAGASRDVKKENGNVELWRIEKMATRVAGRLLGMKDCPMLRCALYLPQNSKELDQKGRNLCPPCQQKLGKLLKDKGIPQKAAAPLVIEKK